MATILPLTADDTTEAADFLRDYRGRDHPRSYWLERFAFWWDANPACTADAVRGWILRDGTRVCGFVGRIPLLWQIGGSLQTAYAVTTWSVAPDQRGVSLLLLARLLAESGSALVWGTTLSETTGRIFEGLRFTPAPYPHQSSVRVPADPRQGWLARMPPILHAFQAMIGHRNRGPELPPCSGVVARLERADERIDALWERTRHQFPTTHWRTAAAVNWYCFGRPNHPKQLIAIEEDGLVNGFVVLRRLPQAGRTLLEVLDLWWDQSRPGVAEALMNGALTEADRSGLDGLATLAYPGLESWLAGRRGRRLVASSVPNMTRLPPGMAAAFAGAATWLVQGEGDCGC
jgi:hypothetical protein